MPFTALIYHRLSADPAALTDEFTLRPAHFRAQVAWLARWGYAGVSVGAAWRAEQAQTLGRRIALAFDDGTTDFVDVAWPVLRAHGFTATLAIPTSRVGLTADWDGPRGTPELTWEQLRALAAEGVEIAAHAHTHRPLDLLAPAELAADLAAAHAALRERLDPAGALGLAYPYGRTNPAVAQAAARAGFVWAATARSGPNTPAPTRTACAVPCCASVTAPGASP
jgi:peptidoglycan/xylan/chitin deacetylase (PgdA/CDA1 family)